MDVLVWIAFGVGLFFLCWVLVLLPRLKTPEALKELKKYRFAHRGLHDDIIPENSITAFKKAMENGFASELDVMMTKDEKLIIMHDYNLNRMCGVNKKVCDVTSEEIDRLRLKGTDEKIPYIEEILELSENRMPLLIEIKATTKDAFKIMGKLMPLLDKYKGLYCIECFDPRPLLWLRFNRPHVVRGQLAGYLNKHGQKFFFLGDFALSFLLVNCASLPDFIAYRYEDKTNPSLKLAQHLYNPQMFYWTVTDKKVQTDVESNNGVIIFEGYRPDN